MKKPLKVRLASGELYYATVLKVVECDPDGSPRRFELMRDDEATALEGGEQFWVVYGPRALSQPTQRKGSA